MSWSSRRKSIYLGIFILLFLIIFIGIYYFFFYKTPTCSDGKQNQDEQGIDCGGSCKIICSFDTINPVILWTRYFKVLDGVYNVVALVENPNLNFEALSVPYSFKLYDNKNILISERTGSVDFLPRTITPIFERTILTGNRVPARNPSFEFKKFPDWLKTDEKQPKLAVKSKVLTNEDTIPRLEVVIENQTAQTVKNIEVTAIISDAEENAIAVSQSFIESLDKNKSEKVFFTWNDPFVKKAYRIEIINLVKPE